MMADQSATMSQAAQLRKILNIMFPHSYIELYHRPPHSVCSIFKTKRACLSEDIHINAGSFLHEASSQPSGRLQVLNLQEQLQESLAEHQAKPVGLCPIRRAIYDQCFDPHSCVLNEHLTLQSDELIRQVTVGCVEQGLLLFQVRNEIRLTISYYRRAYESSVGYGLQKALDALLKVEKSRTKIDQLERLVEVGNGSSLGGSKPYGEDASSLREEADKVDRMKGYYETELAKKDEVIAQQRALIKLLAQK